MFWLVKKVFEIKNVKNRNEIEYQDYNFYVVDMFDNIFSRPENGSENIQQVQVDGMIISTGIIDIYKAVFQHVYRPG